MQEINVMLPNQILNATHIIIKNATQKFYKNGIELEKGAIITERRIDRNRGLYEKICNFWSVYPDLFIDLITPSTSHFKLFFYQRLFLRLTMRYARLFVIAPRAFSKSFISILALYLLCMFKPKGKFFIVAPGKAQSAKIAKEKIYEIWDLFPILKREIVGDGNFGGDYVRLTFRNGSVFDVVSALNSQRGGRRHGGLIDETRDHDADDLNDIVLPLMNVNRKMVNGLQNPNENQQVQFWMSSASDKNTYCYDKAIEMLELSIINPNKAFIFGCDYRVPMQCGLLPKDFLNEIKTSQTFSESSFAKEYMSRFVGSSNEAWFDYEKFLAHRHLVNPETHEIIRDGIESFYLLSVDVARLGCQTVCTVLKVFPRDDAWRCNLVNIYILGKNENEKVFDRQVLELKRLIERFNPKEVIIDINGLGVAFADYMIKETFDPDRNIFLPAYGFFNRDEYDNIQPRNCAKILYGVKASGQMNSDMHSALYAKIYSGCVNFLISEQEAKTKLMATKIGQRMKPEQRIARLMPHELTSILINEIMNLKIKPTGVSNQIAVEQINKRMLKDKFSALEMGIYRMVEMENEKNSRRRNRGLGGKRKLTFFKCGGGK